MAGHPAVETIPLFRKLPFADRQTILCTLCSIRDRLMCESEVVKLLTSECRLFVEGHATCPVNGSLAR
jgi:hypothetical protein